MVRHWSRGLRLGFPALPQFPRRLLARAGQLHNDWLETLITFGRLGSALLLAAGAWILARWFRGGGIRIPWPFVAFFWIALGGCLLHARSTFTAGIYSIQFVFVLLCAALFSVFTAGTGRKLIRFTGVHRAVPLAISAPAAPSNHSNAIATEPGT